jgi:hypothetical protein
VRVGITRGARVAIGKENKSLGVFGEEEESRGGGLRARRRRARRRRTLAVARARVALVAPLVIFC